MILGVANGESYIGSDVPAILKYTRDVYYIGNQEMARVRKGEITFYNLDGEEIVLPPLHFDFSSEPDVVKIGTAQEDGTYKMDIQYLDSKEFRGYDKDYSWFKVSTNAFTDFKARAVLSSAYYI